MKQKFYKRPLNIILSSLYLNIFITVVIFIAMISKQILSYYVTMLQKKIINIFEIQDLVTRANDFFYLTGYFILFFTLLILVYNIENTFIDILSIRTSVYATTTAINNVQKQDFNYFSKKSAGSLNAYLSDLTNIKGFIRSIFYTLSQLASIAVSIYIISKINFNLSIFISFWSLITTTIFYRFNIEYSNLSKKFSKARTKVNGYFTDICNHFITFLTSTNKEKEKKFLDSITDEVYEKYNKIIRLNFYKSVTIALSMFTLVLYIFLIFFFYKIEKDILSIGDITIILGVAIKLFWDLSSLAKQTSVFSEEYGSLFQSTKHLFCSNSEDQELNKKLIISESPEIEFKSVYFSHEETDIFKSISFKIHKGMKLGIVGKTGSGKTTLTYLLLKILSPQKGKILINGKSIDRFSAESVRNSIAFVSQDVEILSRSLKDNMLLNVSNESISKEEFKLISEKSLCSEFALSLSDKYGTKLGDKGTKLSGGQKQRVSIARALFKKASIIIFDEATSALDNITEKAIQNNLETSFKNTTSIFIAHRLSTLINMDKIIVIDKGEIVEYGTHQELINNKKYYHKLWTHND